MVYYEKYKRKSNIIKIHKNLYIFKLFNIYIIKRNKLNEFEKLDKNDLLNLNLVFIFLQFFLSLTFSLYFFFFTFSLKLFLKTKYNL